MFTGIAGFALAAKIVWGNDYENICFCDNNIFCQEVIKKNFGKESLIYGDIKEVTKERIIADTERMRKLQSKRSKQDKREWACDILTGGFPCQPFSQAGKRRGTADDRWLWPEMFRIIKELKPHWIIGENVTGILSMAQLESLPDLESESAATLEDGTLRTIKGRGIADEILETLEQIGYSVQTFIIPAVAKNAPHRRDRVWIVAHSNDTGSRTLTDKDDKDRQDENKGREEQPFNRVNGQNSNAPDSRSHSIQRDRKQSNRKRPDRLYDRENAEWEKNWLEVAAEFCRVDDGRSVELDGFKLSKAKHREERLKALGNAIVPQVAIEIMRAIKQIDEANK